MHADAIGLEALFQLRSSIVTAAQKTLGSDQFSDKISGMINEMIKKNSDKSLGDVLNDFGLKDPLSEKIDQKFTLDLHDIAGGLTELASKFRINNIYSVIPKKNSFTA